MDDPDAPWRYALVLVERLCADRVVLTFIRGGDHRLSRDADLTLLASAIEWIGATTWETGLQRSDAIYSCLLFTRP